MTIWYPSSSFNFLHLGRKANTNMPLQDLIEHANLEEESTSFKRIPTKFFNHWSDMTKARVVTKYKSCCTMLNHLKLINIVFGVRVPHTTCIFKLRTYQRAVCCFFHFWVTSAQDTTQQPKRRICLFADGDSDSTFHTWLQLSSCACLNSLSTKYRSLFIFVETGYVCGHFFTVKNRRYGLCYVKIFIPLCTFLEFYTRLEANSARSFQTAFYKCSMALNIITFFNWWMSPFPILWGHLNEILRLHTPF